MMGAPAYLRQAFHIDATPLMFTQLQARALDADQVADRVIVNFQEGRPHQKLRAALRGAAANGVEDIGDSSRYDTPIVAIAMPLHRVRL
eukprot:COSAG06_NODE_22310_length_727_cov_1.211783_1_plen_88_part_10